MSIRYTTSQPVSDGDQLFISYGREEDLWWNVGDTDSGYGAETIEPPQVDPLIELSGLVDDDNDVCASITPALVHSTLTLARFG